MVGARIGPAGGASGSALACARMPIRLASRLRAAEEDGRLPAVRAYHRIDGPGSSLDLREFQQATWRLPEPARLGGSLRLEAALDPSMPWSRRLPRTVALTIDTGTVVRAEPFDEDAIAVRSVEYDSEVSGRTGAIPATRDNWLLKIVEAFDLSGVRFVLRNLVEGTHSSGLGGSATAATGTALLANHLADRPLDAPQLVGLASRMETEFGVSLTGTQEQSNVLFGGVVDYLWCPWGEPGVPGSGYGSSIRTTLVGEAGYDEHERRMASVHTGRHRASSDTNAAWVGALGAPERLPAIGHKLDAAYAYREALRTRDWPGVAEAIRAYRATRTELCADYMAGADELHTVAGTIGGAVFPLGAGGGGGVLVYHEDPEGLDAIRERVGDAYREIDFGLRARGHELVNLPLM